MIASACFSTARRCGKRIAEKLLADARHVLPNVRRNYHSGVYVLASDGSGRFIRSPGLPLSVCLASQLPYLVRQFEVLPIRERFSGSPCPTPWTRFVELLREGGATSHRATLVRSGSVRAVSLGRWLQPQLKRTSCARRLAVVRWTDEVDEPAWRDSGSCKTRRCEQAGQADFVVEWLEGNLSTGEAFTVYDTHHPIQISVLATTACTGGATLTCSADLGWDGQFAASIVDTACHKSESSLQIRGSRREQPGR